MTRFETFEKAADQVTKTNWVDTQPGSMVEPSDKLQDSDHPRTSVWAIGITPAARNLGRSETEESCPPEVYIG